MKKITLSLIIILTNFNLSLTQEIKITYEKKANIEYQLRNEKDPAIRERVTKHLQKNNAYYELVHSNGISIYNKVDSDSQNSYISKNVGERKNIYKNIIKNNFSFETKVNETKYLISDSLVNYQWKATGETKKILEYNCYEIISTNSDLVYTAWYTPELKITDGPDEFWIDKGLILEISTKAYTINAKKLSEKDLSFDIDKPEEGKEITFKEFKDILEKYKASLSFERN